MAAHQAPASLGFSRQEHWSGLPFPSPALEARSVQSRCCCLAIPWCSPGIRTQLPLQGARVPGTLILQAVCAPRTSPPHPAPPRQKRCCRFGFLCGRSPLLADGRFLTVSSCGHPMVCVVVSSSSKSPVILD